MDQPMDPGTWLVVNGTLLALALAAVGWLFGSPGLTAAGLGIALALAAGVFEFLVVILVLVAFATVVAVLVAPRDAAVALGSLVKSVWSWAKHGIAGAAVAV